MSDSVRPFPVGEGPSRRPSTRIPVCRRRQVDAGRPDWICDFGNCSAGDAEDRVDDRLASRRPSTGTVNCDELPREHGRWTVKEGVNDTEDPNDVFGLTKRRATLLAVGGTSAETLSRVATRRGRRRAPPVRPPGNLRTHRCNQRPVEPGHHRSSACRRSRFPPATGTSVSRRRSPRRAGNARQAEVCIAALGTNCSPTALDATFGAPYVTHVFQVADAR